MATSTSLLERLKKASKIDGAVYESISEAMNATGLKRHTITDRCKSDKFPTYERL